MKLKKINPDLQTALTENGIVEPTELQLESWSTIKSGADCVISAPKGSGKTTAIVLNVIQKLERATGESTRALIFVEDKEKVVEMAELFSLYGNYADLRVLGSHDKGNTDYDKNIISLGLDVLIGTPTKINALFSSAGFNMNTIKMFIVDDADLLFKNRMDAVIHRLSGSVEKTQRIFFTEIVSERVEALADRIMVEPTFFEMDDEVEDDDEIEINNNNN
ncbi:MAG TPA: DEAD/DEAH box helicase [Flavobacterium sp.]|jgi:superfamily II DNA/RNA helicase